MKKQKVQTTWNHDRLIRREGAQLFKGEEKQREKIAHSGLSMSGGRV